MQLKNLTEMDMSKAVDWLIDNQDKVILVDKEDLQYWYSKWRDELPAECRNELNDLVK